MHKTLVDQVVVTTTAWSESIRSFMSKFLMPSGSTRTGPVIGISSMLDAAVYGKVRNTATVVKGEGERLSRTVHIARSVAKREMVVVFCSGAESACAVAEAIGNSGTPFSAFKRVHK